VQMTVYTVTLSSTQQWTLYCWQ